MSGFVQRNWLPAILAMIALFALITAGTELRRVWSSYTPAIEWQGVEVLTSTVLPGGELALVYTAVINKACPAYIRGFLVAKDGSVPVRYPVVAGGYSRPSQTPIKIQVRITVPRQSDGGLAALTPGPYAYRSLATRYCPDGTQEDNAIPDAAFTIAEP